MEWRHCLKWFGISKFFPIFFFVDYASFSQEKETLQFFFIHSWIACGRFFGENARVSGKKGMKHLNMKSGYDLNLCLQTILIALFRRLGSFAVFRIGFLRMVG